MLVGHDQAKFLRAYGHESQKKPHADMQLKKRRMLDA